MLYKKLVTVVVSLTYSALVFGGMANGLARIDAIKQRLMGRFNQKHESHWIDVGEPSTNCTFETAHSVVSP